MQQLTIKHMRVFYARDMVLRADSDAVYLVLPKARRWIAGYFYLLDYPDRDIKSTLNSAILVEYKELKYGASLSAEVETGGVFHNT